MHSSYLDALRRVRFALAWLMLASWGGLAAAHEGHDHGTPPPLPASTSSPRLALQSETYQLVAVLRPDGLLIHLDRYETNEPVVDGSLAVTVGGTEDIVAAPLGDGTYLAVSEQLQPGQAIELLFVVSASAGDDLLIGQLEIPAVGATAKQGDSLKPQGGWSSSEPVVVGGIALAQPHLVGAAALLSGFVLGIAVRSRKRALPATALTVVVIAATTALAFGHEGHDHGAEQVALPATGDAPGRLSDGSVFLPKPSQRLLDVRTILARPEAAQRAVRLIGRVIADPDRSGVVQSTNGGRLIPADEGLPRLGQIVRKGDVLAYVEPALSQADETGIAEQIATIEQEIAMAEAKIDRVRTLATRGVSAQSEVADSETQLAGLKRRLQIVETLQSRPEALRAPVDGVVSESSGMAGQVVGPEYTIFRIIDPASLWVEALIHGQLDPSNLSGASGVTADGHVFDLRLEGFSRALRQQAMPVHFSIPLGGDALSIGEPVAVLARSGADVSAVVLPREAVVRNDAGQPIVWRHAEPERFEAVPVRVDAFDGSRMIVHAGVEEGDRVVVRGAELINQVR